MVTKCYNKKVSGNKEAKLNLDVPVIAISNLLI